MCQFFVKFTADLHQNVLRLTCFFALLSPSFKFQFLWLNLGSELLKVQDWKFSKFLSTWKFWWKTLHIFSLFLSIIFHGTKTLRKGESVYFKVFTSLAAAAKGNPPNSQKLNFAQLPPSPPPLIFQKLPFIEIAIPRKGASIILIIFDRTWTYLEKRLVKNS